MNCSRCNTELPDGSAFCNKCGSPLGGKAPAPAPSPLPPALLVRPPDEPEQELWKGGLSWMAYAHYWLAWLAGTGVLLGLYFGWVRGVGGIFGTILSWTVFILVALPFTYILAKHLYQKLAVRYRLTTHRLFRQIGILSRRINELELIRVDDVSIDQNVIHRLFDVGTITIIAPTDNTDPRLEIYGVDAPLPLKEKIREHVKKRRDRIVNMQSL